MDFVRRASSPSFERSDEKYSLDSAEWYVEAGLNLSLAKIWLQCNNKESDSISIWVPIVDGKVLVSDALAAFLSLHNDLEPESVEGEKHLVVVDVKGNVIGNALRYDIKYVKGSGYHTGVLDPTFGPNDFWHFQTEGQSSCACQDNQNPNPVLPCADKRIQGRVNLAILFAIQTGQYITDVETWSIGPYGTDVPAKRYNYEAFQNINNTSGHSNQDYWTYTCLDQACTTCLDPSDMMYHTQGTFNALSWINNEHCPVKRPLTCLVNGNLEQGPNPWYFHGCEFSYGVVQSLPSDGPTE